MSSGLSVLIISILNLNIKGESKGIINTLLKNAISKGCKSCEASRTKAAAKEAQKPDTIITIVASNSIDDLLLKSLNLLII